MTRDEAIDRLPTAYAIALRMVDEGAGPEEVGTVIGVDDVATLLAIGERKLAALLAVNEIGGAAPSAG